MKKAIIALLTTILAAFGYVVVDKTTDSRLATLESQVSSQQEVIESLHYIGKYSTVATTTTEWKTTNYDGNGAGRPTIVTTEYNEIPTTDSEYFTDVERILYYNKILPETRKVIIYENGYIKTINVGDKVSQEDSSYKLQEIQIIDVKSKLISRNDRTTLVYDDSYITRATIVGDIYIYHIKIEGCMDKSYAGKIITIGCFYNDYVYIEVPTLTGVIGDDGCFVCEGEYSSDTPLYRISVSPRSVR